MNKARLSDLVQMNSPDAVLKEGLVILRLIFPGLNGDSVSSAFLSTVNLYEGRHPGYRACNTLYHDLNHITDTFLAMARMIHGAMIEGEGFSERQIVLGLIASLLHDAGYIQEAHDNEGTGSKYTAIHVQRSMDFFKNHGEEYGLSEKEIADGRSMIHCTDLAADISTITFLSKKAELLGKILGAADLLAQMSDRKYLEKLLLLYYEFDEGNVGDFESEVDILHKTVGFYDMVSQRLETVLDGVDRFLAPHFKARWNIHADLYDEAIQNQKNYLNMILKRTDSDPREFLRREKIVDKVRKAYGKGA
ncbi:MAG: hypothetical protein JRL30_13560 [Deltaproteobacteria bacterium]|nr:hypothetical protein [Deltaproteobacteria bacterium]